MNTNSVHAVTELHSHWQAEIVLEDWDCLSEDWAERRLAAGRRWLHEQPALHALDQNTPGAFTILSCLIRWLDSGWNGVEVVRQFLARFPQESHPDLTLKEYVTLRMAEGVVSAQDEKPGAAIPHFEKVISLCEEASFDRQNIALTHYWKAHCHRKRGEYDAALSHVVTAREVAASLGCTRLVALFQILEGWLCFQQQNLPKAVSILCEAEAGLSETEDHISLGNIYSGLGRIARREGRYEQALVQFSHAIQEYGKEDPEHRNVARSLAHLAYVRRLVALRLQKQLDASSRRRRRAGYDLVSPSPDKTAIRIKTDGLRQRAHADLDRAALIYGSQHTHGGATVRLYRGFLYLDAGELESATDEAEQGFQEGEALQDIIILARARILQSLIESAKHEEGIEDQRDPVIHIQRADEFAKQAVSFARQTQNARLIAHACITQGFTLCSEYLNDLQSARKFCHEAASCLPPAVHDYLREDFELLKSRILQSDSVDSPLKLLAHGLTGDRTFQQITEDFAGIVIPKVWEQEGYKVAAVVRRLSISPKKVRRILQRAGLEPHKGATRKASH